MEKINLNALKQNSTVSYEGSLKEIISLVSDGTIRLLEADNEVVGIDVQTNLPYLEDRIAQIKFAEAYMGKPVMKWVAIAKAVCEGNLTHLDIDVDRILNDRTDDADKAETDEDLPTEVDLDIALAGDEKHQLRRIYKHCLARGCNPTIEYDEENNLIHISDIEWGRKLSRSELETL